MRRFEGKVAFITGASRGQGRSHAVALAREGADVIAVDICADMDSVPFGLGTEDELGETAKLVEQEGSRALAAPADVRDLSGLQKVVDEGLARFGHIDVVCANAGILSCGPLLEASEEAVQDVIDVNLVGAWKTVHAAVPPMVERGQGGSVILTSSVAGLVALPMAGYYSASKHGVVGLMRALAVELAPHGIRVNSVHPSNTDTPMIHNPMLRGLFTGGNTGASRDEAAVAMQAAHALPIPWVESVDISSAVLFLASDDARYVTGTTMPIDGGASMPFKLPNT